MECALTTAVVAYDVDMTGHDDRFDIVTLVVRAREGDIDAFESLVDRYETKLLRFCLRTLGDRQDAEDVVQDTLVQAWKSLNTLSEPAAFGTWIYRLASNKCTDMLRRRMARPSDAQDPDDMRIHADSRVSVEKSVEARTALEHFSERSPDAFVSAASNLGAPPDGGSQLRRGGHDSGRQRRQCARSHPQGSSCPRRGDGGMDMNEHVAGSGAEPDQTDDAHHGNRTLSFAVSSMNI